MYVYIYIYIYIHMFLNIFRRGAQELRVRPLLLVARRGAPAVRHAGSEIGIILLVVLVMIVILVTSMARDFLL